MIQVKKTESIVQSREIPLTRRKNYLEETKMCDAPSQMTLHKQQSLTQQANYCKDIL